MNKLFIIVFMVISLAAFSQKSPVKFGDIPMSDLTMTSYAPDTSASAVVLMDFGKAWVSVHGVLALNFERHVRIKILKKTGLDAADVQEYLYHDESSEEKITNFKATTYNLENGQVVETKVEKTGIFKEKF